MTHPRPFLALPEESRSALVRCAEHGAATVRTLLDMSFGRARKSARGSPLMRLEQSRIGLASARKRVETLVKHGYMTRMCVSHQVDAPPTWALMPHPENRDLSFVAPPRGSIHTAITRSQVAAGLAGLGFVAGRSPETLDLWSGAIGQSTYRCIRCGAVRAPAATPCKAGDGASSCVLAPTVSTSDGPLTVSTDVAFQFRDDHMSRCLVWVDDGSDLADQWGVLEPIARLARDRTLKVIVRPDGFDSAYSLSAKSWPTMGPRLLRMVTLVTKAGFAAARGGSFAHRYVVA